ncbi:hypothetical protein BS47DRAFT_1354209, partial [Hydnum rufescens UP504]
TNRSCATRCHSASPSQVRLSNSPETENQSEPSDMNEDTIVQTWGVSLQQATLTLQLASAAIQGLGDPEAHFEDMNPLRKCTLELAIHLRAIPMPTYTPLEASIGSLIQTNAEQAKALAQNANSIAVLTHILDSQPTISLSDSIHAPVKWTSHLKRSDNPLPIRPSPKKKAPRNHNRHLLIEFYPKGQAGLCPHISQWRAYNN